VSRGQYGNHAMVVSGFGDRLRIDLLANEYSTVYRSLSEQAKVHPEWAWQGWFSTVEPTFKAWAAFRQSAGETLDPATYKVWSDKLAAIRTVAKSLGMKPPMSVGTAGLIGGGVVLGLIVLAAATRRST
jgi:hypothetical protein